MCFLSTICTGRINGLSHLFGTKRPLTPRWRVWAMVWRIGYDGFVVQHLLCRFSSHLLIFIWRSAFEILTGNSCCCILLSYYNILKSQLSFLNWDEIKQLTLSVRQISSRLAYIHQQSTISPTIGFLCG